MNIGLSPMLLLFFSKKELVFKSEIRVKCLKIQNSRCEPEAGRLIDLEFWIFRVFNLGSQISNFGFSDVLYIGSQTSNFGFSDVLVSAHRARILDFQMF